MAIGIGHFTFFHSPCCAVFPFLFPPTLSDGFPTCGGVVVTGISLRPGPDNPSYHAPLAPLERTK